MNLSKTRDQRFWKRWRSSGAVVSTLPVVNEWDNHHPLFWIKVLRKKEGLDVLAQCDCLKHSLERTGLTLHQCGSSKKEIRDLRRVGCLRAASHWLKLVRENTYDTENKNSIERIQRYVKYVGSTLQSIGTTEEELASLQEPKHQHLLVKN